MNRDSKKEHIKFNRQCAFFIEINNFGDENKWNVKNSFKAVHRC